MVDVKLENVIIVLVSGNGITSFIGLVEGLGVAVLPLPAFLVGLVADDVNDGSQVQPVVAVHTEKICHNIYTWYAYTILYMHVYCLLDM